MRRDQLADVAAGNVIDHQHPDANTRPLHGAPEHVQDAIVDGPSEVDVQAALDATQEHP